MDHTVDTFLYYSYNAHSYNQVTHYTTWYDIPGYTLYLDEIPPDHIISSWLFVCTFLLELNN
jgi:hypothetical protein